MCTLSEIIIQLITHLPDNGTAILFVNLYERDINNGERAHYHCFAVICQLLTQRGCFTSIAGCTGVLLVAGSLNESDLDLWSPGASCCEKLL